MEIRNKGVTGRKDNVVKQPNNEAVYEDFGDAAH